MVKNDYPLKLLALVFAKYTMCRGSLIPLGRYYAIINEFLPVLEQAGISMSVPKANGKFIYDMWLVYVDGFFGIACEFRYGRKLPVLTLNVDEPKFAAYLLQNVKKMEELSQLLAGKVFSYVEYIPKHCIVCGETLREVGNDSQFALILPLKFSIILPRDGVPDEICRMCGMMYGTTSFLWTWKKQNDSYYLLKPRRK